jgi:hypothetical protein
MSLRHRYTVRHDEGRCYSDVEVPCCWPNVLLHTSHFGQNVVDDAVPQAARRTAEDLQKYMVEHSRLLRAGKY